MLVIYFFDLSSVEGFKLLQMRLQEAERVKFV